MEKKNKGGRPILATKKTVKFTVGDYKCCIEVLNGDRNDTFILNVTYRSTGKSSAAIKADMVDIKNGLQMHCKERLDLVDAEQNIFILDVPGEVKLKRNTFVSCELYVYIKQALSLERMAPTFKTIMEETLFGMDINNNQTQP